MFADDHSRGFDVYRYKPGATTGGASTWLSAAEFDRTAVLHKATGSWTGVKPMCLLKKF
jgi:hypothetical protein